MHTRHALWVWTGLSLLALAACDSSSESTAEPPADAAATADAAPDPEVDGAVGGGLGAPDQGPPAPQDAAPVPDAACDPSGPDTDLDGTSDACDVDDDNDQRGDGFDNCPVVANPDQLDTDRDGSGDLCDDDVDGDGRNNAEDNCPSISSPDVTDTDSDGQGNPCDFDDDNDTFADGNDACPLDPTPGPNSLPADHPLFRCVDDADRDGRPDLIDNCPGIANPDQRDLDDSARGDACEDADGDGVFDQGYEDIVRLEGLLPSADPVPLPDGEGFVDFDVRLTGPGRVTSVAVWVSILHSNPTDLHLYLLANNVDRATLGDEEFVNNLVPGVSLLSLGHGQGEDAYEDTTFRDDAERYIGAALAPYRGDFKPEERLSNLTGERAQGVWTLRVYDGQVGLTGNVHGWALLLGVARPTDNCRDVPNLDQADNDRDGEGDVCDDDDDNDGVEDVVDNCLFDSNPRQEESDGDPAGDACDTCPGDFDPVALDTDEDGAGDVCDEDDDGDGVPDEDDLCPLAADPGQADLDADGTGDACDDDDDGDTVGDSDDLCPVDRDPDQADGDGDGIGDACDVCRDAVDPDQRDGDGDGIGDACDGCPLDPDLEAEADRDADGIWDACDNCPDAVNRDQLNADFDTLGDACDPENRLLPDLVIDGESVAQDWRIDFMDIGAQDQCTIVEGCVDAPGLRRLLTFPSVIANVGPADLCVPGPDEAPAAYEFSPCHMHWHLLDFANYRLLNLDGTVAAQGHKQSFFLVSMIEYRVLPPLPAGELGCGGSGLRRGWADVYGSGTLCQWVDVTDVPPGDYLLELTVNPHGGIPETDRSNNTTLVPIQLR